MHGGVSDPSFCVFIHRVAFEELSGHRDQVLSEALKLREVEKDVPGSTNTVGKGNAAQNNMVLSWVPTHLF